MVDLCINKFHLVREVSLKCFLAFKLSKKIDMSLERFLILDLFQVFGWFLNFFKIVNEFIKVSREFPRCCGSKKDLKIGFYGKKEHLP